MKKKIIKKYEQLTPEVLKLIKDTYPDGYEESLITFQMPSGELALALPLETEDTSYLIRMPRKTVADDEDDFDSNASSEADFESNFEDLEIADEASDDE